jgi:hypothetical protein
MILSAGTRTARQAERPLSFLIAYLFLAVIILLIERALHRANWHLPLVCDILVVVVFLYLSHEVLPAWFLLFFVAFSAGYRWNLRSSLLLSFGLLLLAIAVAMNRNGPVDGSRTVIYSLPFGATFLGVSGMAFLGDAIANSHGNKHFWRDCPPLHVELTGRILAPPARRNRYRISIQEAIWLSRCGPERIFLWRLKSGEASGRSPITCP